jgi:hypothetical protein
MEDMGIPRSGVTVRVEHLRCIQPVELIALTEK